MSTDDQKVRQEFEARLRQAMQRVDAPAGMLKSLEAAAKQQAERMSPRQQPRNRWAFFVPRPQFAGWMTGALAAVLAVGVFVGGQAYRRYERSVEATRQFETANRITEQALAQTRQQLQQAGVPLD